MCQLSQGWEGCEEGWVRKASTRAEGDSYKEPHRGQTQNCPEPVRAAAISHPWQCPAGTERKCGQQVPGGIPGLGASDGPYAQQRDEVKRKTGAQVTQPGGGEGGTKSISHLLSRAMVPNLFVTRDWCSYENLTPEDLRRS